MSAAEKLEIIRLVEDSELGVKRTLAELGVPRSSFYRWYRAYARDGVAGLEHERGNRRFWNKIPEHERDRVVQVALADPELSPREVAWRITDREGWFISESSVYRILKAFDLVQSPRFRVLTAHDRFPEPTTRVHQLWQTDFTYFRIVGWGWYYLLTVLDDHSRYIVAWKLYTTMEAADVKDLLEVAIRETGVEGVPVHHKPRLLSDNGPCFRARELGQFLAPHGIRQLHGKPYHPMTQGKIERYHRSMKNVIKLEHYYLPGELVQAIERWVEHYNHRRVHEALDNLTPADVYLGRAPTIRDARERLKQQTLRRRRRQNLGLAVPRVLQIVPEALRGKPSLRKSTNVSQIS